MAVLDASIIIAAFSPDEIDPRAFEALVPHLGGDGHVPDLWAIEIANVLLNKVRRRLITRAELAAVWGTISRIPVASHPLSASLVESAILPLALQHDLSSYDASYLELARRLGVPLATLDKRLKLAAAAEGVPVLA